VGGVRVGGGETTGKRRGRSAGKGCLGCVCRVRDGKALNCPKETALYTLHVIY